MKKAIIISVVFFTITQIFGQASGTITYEETIKLDFEAPEGMDLGDMLPNSMTSKKDLNFVDQVSVYRESEENVPEDIEMESDDGSFKMVLKTSDGDEILYTDVKNKISFHQTDFIGKGFLIEEKLEKQKWKLTNEKIKYLGYVCQKATMTEEVPPLPGAKEKEATQRDIVAWFTTEIPVSIGPRGFNRLPGAILMISIDDGKTEIKATKVITEAPDDKLMERPSEGKKVTNDEYEKIMEEKMKEMSKMYGGKGGSIMIRG